MRGLATVMALSLALLTTSPLLAADCDEDTAADLNSQIEANFTILESVAMGDAAVQDRVEALKQAFSEAGDLHSEAFDSGDQEGLNQACEVYESILKEQADLSQ